MKKWITILLALTLSLSVCACGAAESGGQGAASTTEDQPTGLMVGFAKENITPEETVPLSGSATRGVSSGMLDYLFGTCVAISNGGEDIALIFSLDIQNAYSPTPGWRNAISRATGVPESKIMLCFTHTHSAPNTGAEDAAIGRYNSFVSDKLVKAAKAAIADMSPAQAYTTSIKTENLNFVRRYIMNDGTLVGDNFGDTSSGYKCHETEVDNELQLVKFTREAGKDIIMANFQMHSNFTIRETQISSDVAGAFRDALEQKSGVNVIYLNGASGNINPKSRFEEENIVSTHKEWGQKLADYAMTAAENFAPVQVTKVTTEQSIFTIETNHADDHLAVEAAEIYAEFEKTGDLTLANQKCKEAGISSIYHASTIVGNSRRDRTATVELDVIGIGDIAFIFAPVEMFDTNGMYIKENSPYSMTFICGYANYCQGYMPSDQAYDLIGYEVATTMFARGTAEKVSDELLRMLGNQYEK